MIPGEFRRKESKSENESCRGGDSLDHRKGLDGGMGNGDRHEKKGGNVSGRANKGEITRRFKWTYQNGVEKRAEMVGKLVYKE